MKRFSSLFPLILCLFAMLAATGCQQSNFNSIPRTGFITHFSQSDGNCMAFDSYWDISDNKDWNERVLGANGKEQAVHIYPVTLKYFANMPDDPAARAELEALRRYFQDSLMAALRKQDVSDNSFRLVDKPGKDVYSMEVALLSADPTHIDKNVLSTAAGFVVKGGGILLSSRKDKGSISMGARFYAPNGKLVAEVADFEYGQPSLVGRVLADAKDFQRYAYHRRAIDEWVKQFVLVFTTIHEHKIRKPWFTLNPF